MEAAHLQLRRHILGHTATAGFYFTDILFLFRENWFSRNFFVPGPGLQNPWKVLQDLGVWGIIAARRLRSWDYYAFLALSLSLSQWKLGRSSLTAVQD